MSQVTWLGTTKPGLETGSRDSTLNVYNFKLHMGNLPSLGAVTVTPGFSPTTCNT